jgi:outer membrane protein assembly factor BamB
MPRRGLLCVFLCVALLSPRLAAGDWPQWGGTDARNMVSSEKPLPETFDATLPRLGPNWEFAEAPGKNVKWIAKLGSEAYGNPTVSGGKVFVGTNNGSPRDVRFGGDRSVVMCFRESDGKFLWQLVVPKIPNGGAFNGDYAKLGVCSSPAVEGNRVYVVTSRCDVLCLDADGLANGNDGPFVDEPNYVLGYDDLPEKIVATIRYNKQPPLFASAHSGSGWPAWTTPPVPEERNSRVESDSPRPAPPSPAASAPGRAGAASQPATAKASKPPDPPRSFRLSGPPPKLTPTDADIIWRYNMAGELDVWVQDAADCSILVHGDYLYVSPSAGVDKSHRNLPTPHAPGLIVLDKRTGKLLAADDSKMSTRILHGTWSSPSLGVVGGRTLIFFGGPDGICYAFDAKPIPGVGGKPGVLKEVWRFDCNPPEYRQFLYNKTKGKGPSEIIATPAFHKGRVYVDVGQDPRHGTGAGVLCCIDASKTGDVTRTGKVWSYPLDRSLSTVSIADGLLFVGDFTGNVNCLDAETGKLHWTQETKAPIWGSTLVADGKAYIGNGKGELWVFAASKELKVLNTIKLGSPMYNTPIAANGVLYVASNSHLFAVAAGK